MTSQSDGSPVARSRILYTDASSFPPSADLIAFAAQQGLDLRVVDGHDAETLLKEGRECDGVLLIHGHVGDELLASIPRWRVLGRVGTGYDNIDARAASRRGVMVLNVPGFATEELSNQVMLFVLAFSRQLPHLAGCVANRRWVDVQAMPPIERLSEQSIGLIGFGRSAQATAAKARAFGMRVTAWSRTSRPAMARELGVEEVGFDDVIRSDYVSLHVPETPDTVGLISAQVLDHFVPGSVLINIARGSVVDTQALLHSLRTGRLRGAGLDVTDPEPLPPAHPLWREPNVILTLHTGAVSRRAQETAFRTAIGDIGRYLRGEIPRHPVPEMGPSD